MKVKIFTLLSAGLFCVTAMAQNHLCGTDQALIDLLKSDPTLKARLETRAVERAREDAEYKMNQRSNRALTFDTIPIVFHIVHEYGPENIPDQTVIDALAQVNLDYRKGDADTTAIRTAFKSLATGANLVFKLANKDPNGNCTNGIVRHYDPKRTHWDRNNGATSSLYAYTWPASKYLNIYIINEIVAAPGSSGGGIVVGYTYRPGTWSTNAAQDAIVYNYGFLAGKESRSLAHEIGHWLDLGHVFGNTNSPGVCDDDDISDTPPSAGNFSTCPGSAASMNCTSGVEENVQNIMDYSSCPNMFTNGQCNRFRSVLSSSTSGRSTLVSNSNMIATGLWNNPAISCAPQADYSPFTYKTVCAGDPVTFSDLSWGGTETSRSWNFTGGTPSTDTSKSPVVTYSTPGSYNVSLTSTGPGGSSSKTRTGKIIVLPGSTTLTPLYTQDFESATTVASEVLILNQQDDAILWKRATNAAAGGTASFTLNNYNTNQAPNYVDQFVLPAVNLAGYTGVTVSFSYAYRTKNSNTTDAISDSKDQLRVLVSSTCGAIWTPRLSMSGTALASVTGDQTSSFTPTSTQWKTKTITIPTSFSLNNTRVMFELKSAYGNNIFIDNINIDGAVGINSLSAVYPARLTIAPNPFENSTKLTFGLENSSDNVKVSVINLVGQEVKTLYQGYMNSGETEFVLTKNELPASGIYFVKVSVDGAEQIQKLVRY